MKVPKKLTFTLKGTATVDPAVLARAMEHVLEVHASAPGTKLRVIDTANYRCGGERRAKELGLKLDEIYTLDRVEEKDEYTKIWLKEIPGEYSYFNSCNFVVEK